MKQLNSNFTNIEQSKRLLELGLPADSADCGITDDIMYGGREILLEPYSEWCKGYESISVPCWSVGRLFEIYLLCVKGPSIPEAVGCEITLRVDSATAVPDLVNYIITRLEYYAGRKQLDFSKLNNK